MEVPQAEPQCSLTQQTKTSLFLTADTRVGDLELDLPWDPLAYSFSLMAVFSKKTRTEAYSGILQDQNVVFNEAVEKFSLSKGIVFMSN